MPSRLLARQRAFTLIELLVVILVVAILIAVAAPSFLGQQDKAHDSAAKQQLTVARKAAKAIWVSRGQDGYPAAATLAGQLEDAEPQYDWAPYTQTDEDGGVAVADYDTISVARASGQPDAVTLCQQSKSNTFFCLKADERGGLVQLAAAQSPAARVFAVEAAFAASDVVYATADTERGARCAVESASVGGDYDDCPGEVNAGWEKPAAGGNAPSDGDDEELPVAPSFTVAPSVSPATGLTKDSVVTVAPGNWQHVNASDPYSYRWERCNSDLSDCTLISGQISVTYTVTPADRGKRLQAVVTATGPGGHTEKAAATAAVENFATASDYRAAVEASTPKPRYYFTFDESAGSASAQNIGTLGGSKTANGVTFGATGALPGATAAQFDGNDFIDMSGDSAARSARITGEAWVKTTNSATSVREIVRYRVNGWWLGIRGGKPEMAVYTTSSKYSTAAGAMTVSDGQWHHLVGTYDGTAVKLYVDGQIAATTAVTGSVYHDPLDAAIGRDAGSTASANYFIGDIDEFALYTDALSATDICRHYKAAVPAAACAS